MKSKFVMIALLCAMFTSCATIVSGGSPIITIDGNTAEPVTITTKKQVYSNVTLPYKVKVRRHKIDGQRIQIQSATKRYNDIVLSKNVNGWTYGNILLGGIFGWWIDLGTSCISKPSQTYFYIQPLSDNQ